MPSGIADERELSLDMLYKHVCEFQKPHYEKLQLEEDGSVTLTIDKELFSQLDNNEKVADDMFEPIKYSSYNNAFNSRYRNSFKRNLTAMNYKTMENELGSDTIARVTQKDQELRGLYTGISKERDMDNDGVPDRIDADPTRNSVQTVSDLHSVGNSTSGSTERYNDKKERQEKQYRKNQNELEL